MRDRGFDKSIAGWTEATDIFKKLGVDLDLTLSKEIESNVALTAKRLHDLGCSDINVVRKDGMTLLMLAARRIEMEEICAVKTIRWLVLEMKVDLNAVNEDGETALDIAE